MEGGTSEESLRDLRAEVEAGGEGLEIFPFRNALGEGFVAKAEGEEGGGGSSVHGGELVALPLWVVKWGLERKHRFGLAVGIPDESLDA